MLLDTQGLSDRFCISFEDVTIIVQDVCIVEDLNLENIHRAHEKVWYKE